MGIETRQSRYNLGLLGISLKSKSLKQAGSVDNSLPTVLKYRSDTPLEHTCCDVIQTLYFANKMYVFHIILTIEDDSFSTYY
jgi:hypothetical protein